MKIKHLLPISGLFLILSYSISYSQNSKPGRIFDQKSNRFLNTEYKPFTVDSLSNNNLMNKVTILNFWFEACKPCMAEMEGLNELYEKYKHNRNFQFISFCTNDSATVKRLIEKLNIQYRVLAIKRELAYNLNYNNGYPTTIIVNGQGMIVHISCGGPIEKTQATQKVMTEYSSVIDRELRKLN